MLKCGDWSPTKGLNFTFYDEVYREETSLSRKSPLRVVTLVVIIIFNSFVFKSTNNQLIIQIEIMKNLKFHFECSHQRKDKDFSLKIKILKFNLITILKFQPSLQTEGPLVIKVVVNIVGVLQFHFLTVIVSVAKISTHLYNLYTVILHAINCLHNLF